MGRGDSSTGPDPGIGSNPGFTLLEMIVVLILLGVSLSLFLGFNFRQLDGMRLGAAGRDIYKFLNGARSAAMIEDLPNSCLYFPKNGTISQKLRKQRLFLPENVRIYVENPPEDEEEPIELTVFYPDGTAVMNVVQLGIKERRLGVRIQPVLGKVVLDDSPEEDFSVQPAS